jgi:hypothetical protein
MEVLGIFMVRRREILNAQKADPKRNRKKERKETMKDLSDGASSRRKHDEGSNLGVQGNVAKRRAKVGALRIMGTAVVGKTLETRPYKPFS